MKNSQQTDYHAYLLRLWREGQQMPWRAMVEDPHTGQKQNFASLSRLFAFLETQIDPSVELPSESSDG